MITQPHARGPQVDANQHPRELSEAGSGLVRMVEQLTPVERNPWNHKIGILKVPSWMRFARNAKEFLCQMQAVGGQSCGFLNGPLP